jgi:chromosome partitioning protein
MKLVAVISQKGGGGKTTVATNLAAASAAAGVRTLLLDLDPQQSAHLWGRWRRKAAPKTKSPLEIEAADCGAIADKLAAARARGVKLAIIDTPPARGPEADAAAGAAHLVLIVIQPAILDLMTLAETHSLGGVASRPAFIVFNRAPVTGSSLADATERAREAGYGVAPTALCERVVFRAAPVDGLAAIEADKGERKAAAEIESLYRWMIGELAKVQRTPAPAPSLPSFDDPPGEMI